MGLYLTLGVGSVGAGKSGVFGRHPGSEAVALIQCDGEHLVRAGAEL